MGASRLLPTRGVSALLLSCLLLELVLFPWGCYELDPKACQLVNDARKSLLTSHGNPAKKEHHTIWPFTPPNDTEILRKSAFVDVVRYPEANKPPNKMSCNKGVHSECPSQGVALSRLSLHLFRAADTPRMLPLLTSTKYRLLVPFCIICALLCALALIRVQGPVAHGSWTVRILSTTLYHILDGPGRYSPGTGNSCLTARYNIVQGR